ncbi:glycosyltransferase [Psychrobacillus glaciei]|uniref:Glycosyltransferase n=2 Tax=Psychrobacillus glaciei TaxID=2283160 RepID=A0A5J6ST92_9BACI|nr:glycosyltransferase [Psychrobacillus glaciei]
MIVKDEARSISNCLESVKGLVSEMIIIDTGSTDQTIDICKKHGAKVYPYMWKNDFADARNYGLSYATGDWILWLDADEELDATKKFLLQEILAHTNSYLLSLPILNYYGKTKPVNKDHVYLYYQLRVFRNYKDITFHNRIHETPLLPAELTDKEIENISIPIHHYGYLEDITETKQKGQRNLQLLQQEVADPSHSPWIEYHLASEYYRQGKYLQAFQYVNESILLFLHQNQLPPSLLYKLKYAMLIETNSLDGAWPSIEKAILLYPDYVDLHFYKGDILYKMKNYREALQAFEKCLELGDHHTEYLILKGTGSFKAGRYKGLCLEQLGRSEEAQEAFGFWDNTRLD